ncbi:hypothetical protein L4174_007980 [Photobacterium sp. CCB-ST2H9]|uniref:hypothetical protein n=1 Tax=unclassified Photobacterium TaxID=2628852 RepID=UPI0020C6FB66|nr:hypothetical protein [Photobacterium sp. CCB-ST2H9]UTM58756.1 hypothetical protein L4174_007980 [Photobacterium sp. CCB-ST2H9]
MAQVQADDERLIRSLEEQGIICEGLTYAEKQEALRIYLNRKAILKDKKQKDKKQTEKDTTNSSDSSDMAQRKCISPE